MKRIAAFLVVLACLQCPSAARAGNVEARDINDFIVNVAKDIAGYLRQARAVEVAVVPFKNKDGDGEYALSEVLTGALVRELRYSQEDFRILGPADGAPAFRVTGLWGVVGDEVRVTTRIMKMPAGEVTIDYAAVIPLKRVPRVYVEAGKPAAGEMPDKGIRLAIMDFEGAEAYPDVRYLSKGVPESMTTVFAKQSDLVLVERLQRDKIMAELNLAESRYTDPDAVVKVGKLLGVNYMVIGSFQRRGRQLRLMARRVKVETGEIFEAADVVGSEDELFALEDSLSAKLLADIQRFR